MNPSFPAMLGTSQSGPLHRPWESLPESPQLSASDPGGRPLAAASPRSAPAAPGVPASSAGKHNLANTAHLYAPACGFSPAHLGPPVPLNSPYLPGMVPAPPPRRAPTSRRATPRPSPSPPPRRRRRGPLRRRPSPTASSPSMSRKARERESRCRFPSARSLNAALPSSGNREKAHPAPVPPGSYERLRAALHHSDGSDVEMSAKQSRPRSRQSTGPPSMTATPGGTPTTAPTGSQSSSSSRRKRKPPPIRIDSSISNFSHSQRQSLAASALAPRSAPPIPSLPTKRETASPGAGALYSPLASPFMTGAFPYKLFGSEYAAYYPPYCATPLAAPFSPVYGGHVPYSFPGFGMPMGDLGMGVKAEQLIPGIRLGARLRSGSTSSSGFGSGSLDTLQPSHSAHGPSRPLPLSAGYFHSLAAAQQASYPFPKGPQNGSGAFVFLCFFPGTSLKILMGDDVPAAVEYQRVEAYQLNNVDFDVGANFRLMDYVKSDEQVELNLKPVGHSGEAAQGSPLGNTRAPSHRHSSRGALCLRALCPTFHPFYNHERGWLSLDPLATLGVLGLSCQQLSVSDVISAHPPDLTSAVLLAGVGNMPFGMGWPHAGMGVDPSSYPTEQTRLTRGPMEGTGPTPNGHWQMTSPTMGNGGLIENQLLPGNRQPRIRHKDKKREKERAGAGDDKTKRPMNAFMLFAQRYRVVYTQQFPGRDNRAISCMLGEHWKKLSHEERQQYTEQAKQLAVTYKEKNPNCWKRRSSSRSDSDAQASAHSQSSAPLNVLTPTTTTASALNALVLLENGMDAQEDPGWQGSSDEQSPLAEVDVTGCEGTAGRRSRRRRRTRRRMHRSTRGAFPGMPSSSAGWRPTGIPWRSSLSATMRPLLAVTS
ncbi:LOW QUALITY PROTEIN: uncharacterized protein LOC129599008 [Paramacrobiotus metropolitanus]|uniref:LOW QUALITY PROTEIN: uncharacterized protein LOC129599008 n=1 Tax=Paramacrobiotus metropolitanus TaxID=2943436 RepID=UPI0024455F82|nr:LOW QUALITY PROTEIN: uncharacterized protein LOC129599008 [Paramacrobiotus metropolitanus]